MIETNSQGKQPSNSHPKILVTMNGKGGVGKTTTAVNVAAILAGNYSLLLVDTDPQGSAAWWCDRNSQDIGFDVASEQDPQLLGKLRQISDYELIVVDTPPALNADSLAAVLTHADYLILPTPPAPMDLAALIDTVRQSVTPTDVSHRVLLTRVDTRSLREALEAQNTLQEMGIPAFHAFVRAYKAHEQAALNGVAIDQLRGKKAQEAASDYRRVADEICRDLQLRQGASRSTPTRGERT
ncbi:ParA family protein [Geitlerinema sp. PCC 9228]|uniref:ParA family protein n=1 Tax=Geitlerinema sp. PCC 9228 TaxID=111611 RepID=UPI0008F9D9E3|nr:ParA family protein [Geitlerinema sp. PCC 9228]